MNIFKVFNLNPVNFFEKKPTWGFELGVQNKQGFCAVSETDCFLNGALAKYGTARTFGSESLVGWGLGTFNLRYGQRLPDSNLYAAVGFELQKQMVKANGTIKKTFEMNTSHLPFVVNPTEFIAIVRSIK